MIREMINEKRSAAGLNGLSTGRAGKGQAPRQSERPWFAGLKPCGRSASGLIEFRKNENTLCYVPEEDVRKWERISGEKIISG